MRKINLLLIFILLSFSTFAQIQPWGGIIDHDSCKFENHCSLVKLDTSLHNIWQIGKPSKPFFDTAFSAPNAIVTDTINPYPIANNSYFDLIIPNIFLPNLIVGFKHKFQTDSLTDGGYIEESDDNGATWVNIAYEDTIMTTPGAFNTENLYPKQDTLQGGESGFSGTSNGWIYSRIQWIWLWPCKQIPPDTLILRFHFISDSIQTNKAGWMIDNILISWAIMSGINESENNRSQIHIIPNPVDDIATIKFDNSGNEIFNITIYDPLGQIIKIIENIKSNQVEIKRGDFTEGLYFVQLRNDNKILGTGKLIIK